MNLPRRLPLFLVLLLALAALEAGCRAKEKPSTAPTEVRALTPEQRQRNLESFDYVWTTIQEKHWDPAFNGTDWAAVGAELRPRMQEAQTMAQARAVLQDMIDRLNQSHFGILPASVYREIEVKSQTTSPSSAPGGGSDGVTGIDVRVLEGKVIVTRVFPDSPAARAGVRTGWEVKSVGERKLSTLLEKLGQSLPDNHLRQAVINSAVAAALDGRIGESQEFTFVDGDDRPVKKTLTFGDPPGTRAVFGNLPPFYVTFESRRIPPNVGYVTFSAFFDPEQVMTKFAAAMSEYRDADGIILDLRGNPGGIGAMAMGIGNFFVLEPNQRLGTMHTRSGSLSFVLNPRPPLYRGPLAILVDELSMSTSEILAGGLQDLGRAKIFGTRSPGAALPSVVEKLPNGDGFQYAFANYISTGGQPLEGRGVVPDIEVKLDRASLLAGREPVIDAAVAWIESQKQQPPQQP